MTPAALTAVPEPHELESDRVEAAPMLRRELRAVDPCPDEAAVSPRSRPHHAAGELVVPRPELYARLTGAARVTQLSAGAGSGKTVLLQSWIDHSGLAGRAAGLFLDHEEREAQRFWLSVRQALHGTTAGEALVGELTAAGNLDGWTIIDRLTDDLTPLREAVWVVIDGVDELRTDELRHQLEYFIKSAPRQVRFVLSSRSDPHLGLHRLRVYGDLTELRTPDLRFTETEARALFESVGIRLSDVALKQLLERTDGWAGGLRLAAIAMAGHGDPERFASEFSGSERTVAAYLLAEVLERQPAEVRELLLHTSLLDRVSGPLADYVTGGSGAERTLLELEDANAFVTSIDAGRSWFRYHRLFAEFLRLELRRAYPTAVRSLHRAAADWFEREGDAIEAIRHAQAACDWRRAAHLLLDHRIALILEGRLASLRELLHAFPAQAIADDSELAVTFACVGLRDGLLDEADAYIASAERQAADVAEGRAGQLELHLASVRLAAATQRGDLCAARHAMHALEAARAARPPAAVRRAEEIRALALMTLGTSELWSLELADARRHLQEGLTLARRIERPYLEVGCLAHLAIAAPLSGQSASAALDLTEDAVAVAEANGLATDPIVALAFAIGAGSLAWLGRFDDAERWLERAEQALDSNRDPGTELALHHARGLLHSGQGRLEEALSSFRRAEDVQALLIGQHALTVDLRMRIILTHVRMGAVAEARAALDGLAATERDRAESHIAAAAVHLAEGDPERAAELLVPVTELSVAALIPAWAAVHGLLLNALAQEQLGDRCAAEASVERALELAEPGGLILPFAIFPIQDMLERHPRHRTAHAALRVAILDVLGGAAAPPRGEPALLVDDLSEAELRVLRYLPSNLRAPEIASELYISTNTVRTHVRHIYAKLDAHGRAEAVARGRQLGLLAPVRRLR